MFSQAARKFRERGLGPEPAGIAADPHVRLLAILDNPGEVARRDPGIQKTVQGRRSREGHPGVHPLQTHQPVRVGIEPEVTSHLGVRAVGPYEQARLDIQPLSAALQLDRETRSGRAGPAIARAGEETERLPRDSDREVRGRASPSAPPGTRRAGSTAGARAAPGNRARPGGSADRGRTAADRSLRGTSARRSRWYARGRAGLPSGPAGRRRAPPHQPDGRTAARRARLPR